MPPRTKVAKLSEAQKSAIPLSSSSSSTHEIIDLTGVGDDSIDPVHMEVVQSINKKGGKSSEQETIEDFQPLPINVLRPDITMAFYLINTKEFTARIVTTNGQPLPIQLLYTFQFVPNIRFDMAKSRWMIPLTYHDQLQATLEKRHRITIEPLPKATLLAVSDRCLREVLIGQPSTEQTESCNEELRGRVPEALLRALAPFQRQGVQFVLRNEGRALIADEMGLGKTRSSIACAVAYQEDWPVLVVCPSSARHHWQAELLSLLVPSIIHSRDVVVVENAAQSLIEAGRRRHYKFVIISYNLVQKMTVKLEQMGFNVIICDECHYLKNAKARRTKALVPMIKASRRAIMVSGTPALSRPMELFTQLNALAPLSWPDEKEFGKRYCRIERPKGVATGRVAQGVGFSGGEYKGASNTKELHVMLTGTLMLRRLKKDILLHLPPKERHVVRVEVQDPAKKRDLRTLLTQVRQQEEAVHLSKGAKSGSKRGRSDEKKSIVVPGKDDAVSKERKSLLLQLFTRSGEAKLPGVIKHIARFLDAKKKEGKEMNENSGKLLIFGHHRVVMDGISKFLDSRKQEYIRIDGQTNGRERHAKVAQFQQSPSCRVALLAITAAGIAITLTAANHVYFAEMFWTPGSLIQAEDRAHRIGQASSVKVTYFLAPGTVDDVLWPLIRRKMKTLGEVVEGTGGSDFAFETGGASTIDGDQEAEEPDDSSSLVVEQIEELATEMAVESVLQTRAEGKVVGEDEDDDDDVQDVLGIDATLDDNHEDAEWPDAFGALYLSTLAAKTTLPVLIAPDSAADKTDKLDERHENSISVACKWTGIVVPKPVQVVVLENDHEMEVEQVAPASSGARDCESRGKKHKGLTPQERLDMLIALQADRIESMRRVAKQQQQAGITQGRKVPKV